ncbi:hypothetical protein G7Y89_g13194 [Cudoniella acicularis]|uniref:Uncharacterized protein n=1 Tax=Cudoniella acicularis TaxID=354080 RepID=A0A8H4R7D1_9HELO|nr:hypothetical protein G7Y89_g13194 [Cudoniella acicularis]
MSDHQFGQRAPTTSHLRRRSSFLATTSTFTQSSSATPTIVIASSASAPTSVVSVTSVQIIGITSTPTTTLNTITSTLQPKSGTYFRSSSSSGLSTGAKAAIGVGITFGVILILGILCLVFYLGRKTANKSGFDTFSTALVVEPELGGEGKLIKPAEMGDGVLEGRPRDELQENGAEGTGNGGEDEGEDGVEERPGLEGGEMSEMDKDVKYLESDRAVKYLAHPLLRTDVGIKYRKG